MDDPLAQILEKFNRKERNLLIRDILGCPGEELCLSDDFCKRLESAVGISPKYLKRAWWATDFHFDWLAGALLTFLTGGNAEEPKSCFELVKGNQEDLDLIIAAYEPTADTRHHLILIEAKAYRYFSPKQHNSKVNRSDRLYEFYEGLKSESKHKICFYYVHFSAGPHENIPGPKNIPQFHLELKLPGARLAVMRCDKDGTRDANGGHWRIEPFGGPRASCWRNQSAKADPA